MAGISDKWLVFMVICWYFYKWPEFQVNGWYFWKMAIISGKLPLFMLKKGQTCEQVQTQGEGLTQSKPS